MKLNIGRIIVLFIAFIISIFMASIQGVLAEFILGVFRMFANFFTLPEFIDTAFLGIFLVTLTNFLLGSIIASKFSKKYSLNLKHLLISFGIGYVVLFSLSLYGENWFLIYINSLIILIILLSLFFGFVLAKRKWFFKWVGMGLLGLLGFFFIETYGSFLFQQVNFEEFTGKTNKEINFADVGFYDDNLKPIQLEGEKFVFDFWHNSCAQCFALYPDFQAVYDQAQLDQLNYKFYTINVIYNKDKIQAVEKSKRLKERFKMHVPTIYMDWEEAVKIGITSYPTVYVVEGDRLVFVGFASVLNKFRHLYK